MAQINKPTDYFNTKLFTTSASELNVTGVGFQPDWVWVKSRSNATDHGLFDGVRGVQKLLISNGTDAESTTSGLTSFDSDGFTLGTANSNFNGVAGRTMVGWNWLAGGTASSNTDGSITSNVSANTTSGFSIVSYTGNGTAGATIGHSLTTAPACVIIKRRNSADAFNMYHQSLGATKYLKIDRTDSATTSSLYYNDTAPTSSVFSVGNETGVNNSSDTYIAYCFAEKKGFSKFGSYTGNGSTDGPMIYTGFKPAWFMIKSSSNAEAWEIGDNKRDTENVVNNILIANSSGAETAGNSGNRLHCDFVSNGVKLRGNASQANQSGSTYIYMAFAEQPLVGTNNIPAVAR